MHYVPSVEDHELRIERKWKQCRNQELEDKKSGEEELEMMKEWSKAKSKI
jgi:hypothetical protein